MTPTMDSRSMETIKPSQRLFPPALRCLAATAFLLLGALPIFAQSSTPEFVEYSAKFVCGTPTSTQVSNEQIAAGTYDTTINIHNPDSSLFSSQTSLSFFKKAVLSLPEGTSKVAPSSMVQDNLEDDYAEEVDCKIIRSLLGTAAPAAPAYIEGYVVVIVPPTSFTNQLDVIGIYSNSKGALQVVPADEHLYLPNGGSSKVQTKAKDSKGK
jgi:hypothetical protein